MSLRGSKPRDEMFREKPPDFWSRMSRVVEMDHPLDVGDDVEMRRVARSYFSFFWLDGLEKFFAESELLPFPYASKKAINLKMALNLMAN